jgi:His-Xaa-Ser system radical SAM maturase HxsC
MTIDPSGYAAIMFRAPLAACDVSDRPVIHGVGPVEHLAEGDLVALQPSGRVQTLYRPGQKHNVLFATENCNSYCVMCSQPPRVVDDSDRLSEHLRLIELIAPPPAELGITGGEPTLLKDGFLDIVRHCRDYLPNTALHVLSNGRLFRYPSFAERLAALNHPDLMLGIPLYSDIDTEHDFVVQCRGAFDDTMLGLQHLGRFGIPIELRVVIHRTTFGRLESLAEFIYHNLTFVSQVAFMGLEITGFAVPNLDALWIDPVEYEAQLRRAVLYLAARGMSPVIFNHQLCTVPRELWPYCRQSISDWKNEFLPLCAGCAVRDSCGGFFASGVQRRYSAHIQPIPPLASAIAVQP